MAYLADALTTMPDLAAYRYLVIAMLTSRRAELTAAVLQTARLETHRGRIGVLLEVLDLFAANPEIAALAEICGSGGRSASLAVRQVDCDPGHRNAYAAQVTSG